MSRTGPLLALATKYGDCATENVISRKMAGGLDLGSAALWSITAVGTNEAVE
jgi:hypothetical protein